MCNQNLREIRSMVMSKAHAMCKEMKEQGLEFNYHTQLGLNMKYLWEVVKATEIEDEIETQKQETCTIEYVDHVELKDNSGYSFLFEYKTASETVEFTAVASRLHKYPIAYDVCPQDIELLETLKVIINDKTGIYNHHEFTVPEYRYHRGEDLFVYYDETAGVFKGYYCGTDVYGGRAFVFDMNNTEDGPCSRGLDDLVKDHKANDFKKYTTMNGKGVSITKWKETILSKCRQIYKATKNQPKIEAALSMINKPWKTDYKTFISATMLLDKLEVSYDFQYASYEAAIDAELRHISKVRANGNTRYGIDTQKKFQDRIKALKLTNLITTKTADKPQQPVSSQMSEFANLAL